MAQGGGNSVCVMFVVYPCFAPVSAEQTSRTLVLAYVGLFPNKCFGAKLGHDFFKGPGNQLIYREVHVWLLHFAHYFTNNEQPWRNPQQPEANRETQEADDFFYF